MLPTSVYLEYLEPGIHETCLVYLVCTAAAVRAPVWTFARLNYDMMSFST